MVGFGLTPGTGVGVSVDGMYRNGNVSFNAEFRIIGSQVMEAGAHDGVRTLRGGQNVSACGHLSVAFLCGVVGWSRVEGIPGTYIIKIVDTKEPVSGNFGFRTGLDWRFHDRLAVRMFGELFYAMGQPSVWVNHEKFWAAPPVAGILGLGMVFPMGERTESATTAFHGTNATGIL